MPACAPINPAAGSAETMVATVDCYVQSNVQAGYASLLGPGQPVGTALTIALTLYVAFVGYRLIFGRSSLSMGDMVPRMLLIGAVLALSSNWATYQTLVYDVLTDGPAEIAGSISPGADKAGLNERVDMLSGRMVDLADAWTEFDARPEQAVAGMPTAAPETLPATATSITAFVAPKDSLGPNMLLVSALAAGACLGRGAGDCQDHPGPAAVAGPGFRHIGAVRRNARPDARLGARSGDDGAGAADGDTDDGGCSRAARADFDRNVCCGGRGHFLAPLGADDTRRAAGHGRGVGAAVPHWPHDCRRLDDPVRRGNADDWRCGHAICHCNRSRRTRHLQRTYAGAGRLDRARGAGNFVEHCRRAKPPDFAAAAHRYGQPCRPQRTNAATADRRIARGRVAAVRAPIKPVRNAA